MAFTLKLKKSWNFFTFHYVSVKRNLQIQVLLGQKMNKNNFNTNFKGILPYNDIIFSFNLSRVFLLNTEGGHKHCKDIMFRFIDRCFVLKKEIAGVLFWKQWQLFADFLPSQAFPSWDNPILSDFQTCLASALCFHFFQVISFIAIQFSLDFA